MSFTIPSLNESSTSWTTESVERALNECERQHKDASIFQLALSTIPQDFAKSNPTLTYRFIRACVTRDFPLKGTTKTAYIQFLRTIHPGLLPDLGLIFDNQGGHINVNKVMLELTFPGLSSLLSTVGKLPYSSAVLAQIVKYMYTDRVDTSILSVGDLFSIMSIGRTVYNLSLERQAFSSILDRFFESKDTLEERCAVLGLAFLDSTSFQREGRFAKALPIFAREVFSLAPSVTILSVDPKIFARLLSRDDWYSLLPAVTISSISSKAHSCLGPIHPRYFARHNLESKTFESAVFRAVLKAEGGGVVIRLKTIDEFLQWKDICQTRGRDGRGLVVSDSHGESFFVRVDEIELAPSLAVLLRERYGTSPSSDLSEIVPSPNKHQQAIVIVNALETAKCPYPSR